LYRVKVEGFGEYERRGLFEKVKGKGYWRG
jgi:hypothetical protein